MHKPTGAATGHVREVDLLVAVPAGLFVIEIKSHPRRLTNQRDR